MWDFLFWLLVLIVGLAGYLTGFSWMRLYLSSLGDDWVFNMMFSVLWPATGLLLVLFFVVAPLACVWLAAIYEFLVRGPGGALAWGKYVYNELWPGEEKSKQKKK